MKRPRFRRWIGSILFCRSRRDEPSVTGLSITDRARFLCMPRWTPRPAACMEKPRRATPAATSWLFWKKWCRCAGPGNRFTSSSTTSRLHKTQSVADFLQRHPRVQFHFTPTYSSWLNQVELWFAKIEREVIARGIFTSVPDLARKLRRYINAYSANARPIQWKYSDPSRRLRANEFNATVH